MAVLRQQDHAETTHVRTDSREDMCRYHTVLSGEQLVTGPDSAAGELGGAREIPFKSVMGVATSP